MATRLPKPTQERRTLETREWLDSLDAVLQVDGPARVSELLRDLSAHASERGVRQPFTANTPYINTIHHSEQPVLPGNREIERRIKSLVRWNAMAMVVRANQSREESIGGHISTNEGPWDRSPTSEPGDRVAPPFYVGGAGALRVILRSEIHTDRGTHMTSNATTQTEALLLTETKDGVATLTLNRPGQFNALSSALIDELQATFDRLGADPTVSVVVLAANGRGFCAGHDLKEIRAMGHVPEVESLFERCSRMMMTITTLPQAVIARVHGIATAAGCQLVATCDLAVASTAATFATPGVNIGAFCSTPSVALGRAVGRKHAMEMLLTGETVGAVRAYEIGLVNRVVSPEAIDAEVETLARCIASKSSAVIASGKQVFYRQLELSLGDAYSMAGHAIACDLFTEDGKEGVDAFVGRRAPRWKNRQ